MPGKILFAVTNHCKLGNTGNNKTGWYLPEVAHPHQVLTEAGFEITYISPKGGNSPMDEGSKDAFKEDPVCKDFLQGGEMAKLAKTLSPEQVNPSDFVALFFPGGHGPMFDMKDALPIADLAAKIYNKGGVLGAVCHGTVGFLPITLPNGEPLVKGKKVTCFTDAEEDAVQLTAAMPFLLETELKKQGATFVGADNWACNVQVCDRLVTGQNPASATETGKAMLKLLS